MQTDTITGYHLRRHLPQFAQKTISTVMTSQPIASVLHTFGYYRNVIHSAYDREILRVGFFQLRGDISQIKIQAELLEKHDIVVVTSGLRKYVELEADYIRALGLIYQEGCSGWSYYHDDLILHEICPSEEAFDLRINQKIQQGEPI